MTRTRGSFTDEFKRESVKLCKQTGATATHIARDLGIQTSVLRRWVIQERGVCWTSGRTGRFAVRLPPRWRGCNSNCVE